MIGYWETIAFFAIAGILIYMAFKLCKEGWKE